MNIAEAETMKTDRKFDAEVSYNKTNERENL